MQSDIAKSDGINSDLRIRWPKSSYFGPKSDDSVHRILISKKGIGFELNKNLIVQGLDSSSTTTRYHIEVRVAIDALDYEYNHDARTQSRRLSAARLQLAFCRRGLGPRDQEEQRTQRASFVAAYHTSTRSSSSSSIRSSCWSRMLG